MVRSPAAPHVAPLPPAADLAGCRATGGPDPEVRP